MRNLVALVALVVVVVAAAAVPAWVRVGHDRHAALGREALALARVLRGAALEAEATLDTAERNLQRRLAAVARRIELALTLRREGAAPLLQRVAGEEGVGRIYLFDGSLRPVTRAHHPAPLPGGGGGLLTDTQKAELEWSRAKSAVEALNVERGAVVSEGLRRNVYGTRERFGIAYGLETGGVLLLRTEVAQTADLRSFGLQPVLDRIGEIPGVGEAALVGADDASLLTTNEGATPDPAAFVTARLPIGDAGSPYAVVRMSRASADAEVAASRRVILFAALAVVLVACVALGLLHRADARRREERARAAGRLEEERRLAEMGALAGLVAHEVSNPVNALTFGVRLLQAETTSEERAEILATMQREVQRVSSRIEGFLRLAGGRTTEARSIGADLLGRVRQRLTDAVKQARVSLVLDVEAEAPLARGDPLVLEEAVVNVVRNALDASPPGGTVTLAWRRLDDDVAIEVADEGSGFPEDRDALLRVGGEGHRRGHGLGLPLTRRFVSAHGGRLVLGDRPEGGALVTIRLPIQGGADE